MTEDDGHDSVGHKEARRARMRPEEKARALVDAIGAKVHWRRDLARVDPDLFGHANAVPGWWVGLSNGHPTGSREWCVCRPSERPASVPWAVPGGLKLYDRNGLETLLRDEWLPDALAWLSSTG